MKPRQLIDLVLRAVVACSMLGSVAHGAPAETPSRTITRTAQSGLNLQTALTKNVYRQEAYQDTYSVEVPYEDTETYYEDVPYEERVPYTDWEEYYEREWRCHDEYEQQCGNERVCKTVYDRQCRTENECRPGPTQRECTTERQCRNIPGEPVCETQQKCETRPGSPNCHMEQRCEDRPGRPECRVENRCETVPGRENCHMEERCEEGGGGGEENCRMEQECRDTPRGRMCREKRVCEGGGRRERRCHKERVCEPGGSEQRCHPERICEPGSPQRECRNERVCEPGSPQRECHDERVCHPGPGRQECTDVPRCREVPGQPICGPVEKCQNVPRQECNNEWQCHPVKKQKCDYEQVRKTRQVTKWRTEIRYRKELRTRTVVRYRTEERCCVTRYRDVFDRQTTMNAIINFPAGSELQGVEQETFRVNFIGDGSTPAASLKPLDTIFGYSIANQSVTGDSVIFDLALAPKYTEAQIGQGSVDSVKLSFQTGRPVLQIRDRGNKPRVQTSYSYEIKDKATGAVLATGSAQDSGKQDVSIPVATNLDEAKSMILTLNIERSGLVLAAPINFVATGEYSLRGLNPADFGVVTISQLGLTEDAKNIYVGFKDMGAADRRMTSTYTVRLFADNSQTVALEKSFRVKDVLKGNWIMSIPVDVSTLPTNTNYTVQVFFHRDSTDLARPVDFQMGLRYVRMLDMAQFQDVNLLGGFGISGAGVTATLVMRDDSPAVGSVQSSYNFVISSIKADGTKIAAVTQTKTREQIKLANGLMNLNLATDLGLKSTLLAAGTGLQLDLTVTRTSARLNEGKPIVLTKSLKLVVGQ